MLVEVLIYSEEMTILFLKASIYTGVGAQDPQLKYVELKVGSQKE